MVIRECEVCQRSFEGHGNRKYCNECIIIVKKEQSKKDYQKLKDKREKIFKNCGRCDNLFEVKSSNQKYCDKCMKTAAKERTKQYYLKHKEEIKKQKKGYDKQYYQNHKEEIKTTSKEYYQEHKENLEYKEKRSEYYINRKKTNVQYIISIRLRSQFNQAKKKYTKEERVIISKNKKMDYKAIFEHLKPFPKDLENYHIDHIIPLTFFDLTDEKQVKLAWNPINLQWLKTSDNRSKKDKIDFKEYPKQEEVFYKLELDKLNNKKREIKNE